jgi:hypothetical protein
MNSLTFSNKENTDQSRYFGNTGLQKISAIQGPQLHH